jgi:thioredoxin 1
VADRECSLAKSTNSLAAMFGSNLGSVDDSITRLTLPLCDQIFNFLNGDVSDARNSDEAKSPPKRFTILDYQQFMRAASTWHSQCLKPHVKQIRVERMNRTQNEEHVIEVGKINFESEVLSSKQPVLVVFWAPWSKACRVLRPVLNKVMRASNGGVKFVKINADENPDLSLWYGIHSIPALLYFVNGVVCARITGTASQQAILAKLESITENNDSSISPPGSSNEH